MNGESTKSAPPPCARPWLPFLLILAASALAHLWCLGSQFYLDDMNQIRDSELVRNGTLLPLNRNSWTQLFYVIQYRLFGMTPVAFHAVNWLLHTAVACVLFGFGRDFLRGKWPEGVALFGALLFAVHPLASEIPNYARTQDLAWVTLFSLLAAWAMLRYLREDGWELAHGPDGQIPVLQRTHHWRKLVFCALAVAGATFSKGPGLFHAVMAVAVVGLACLLPEHWKWIRRRGIWILGSAVVVISAAWMSGLLDGWIRATAKWAEPRFIGHAYTLSRVFWEFGWRSVMPVSLSADHLITETLIPPGTRFWNIPDKGAMLAMAGFLALTAFSMFLAWRKSTRLFGVCLFLYAATMLLRFLYLIPEFMPEYRIYPGLPWFCLGAAILLAAVWKFLFETMSPRVPAVILLGLLAFLSAKRSFLWHDLDKLTADILKQYPANARVLWELHDRDVAKGNWQAIIDRQTTMWPEIERQFVQQNQQLAPAREIPSGHFVLSMIAIHGRYARAIAHTQNPAAGLRVMAQLELHMRRMQMTPENKVLEWGYFYHDKALILEQMGNLKAAAELLRKEEVPPFWPKDLERVEKKLATAQP
ncbi:MAG: hypothetical protein V4689_08820 [Verrucomicrobiota bacterium]